MQKKLDIITSFKSYPSIELSTNTKFTKTIYQQNFNNQDILWVASQKIHGANFCICYDFENDLVRYGRRNDFISKDIPVPVQDLKEYFTENFFDAIQLVKTFHNNLIKIKQNVLKKYSEDDIKGIQIYGQYFGGFWPENVQCKKRVQIGVYYTPNHQFMAFDIKLVTKNHHNWVQVTQIPNLVENYLKYVPIYSQGKFDQVLKVSSEFDSTIPKLLGLNQVKDNICEGLIIRPNRNLFSKHRVILKKKNKQFLQKVGHGKNQIKEQKKYPYQINQYLSKLQQFLNINRVQSSISKHPDFLNNFILKGYVVEDIINDAKKQGYIQPQIPKIAKQVYKQLDRMVLTFVNDYLQNQRKQFKDKIKKTK